MKIKFAQRFGAKCPVATGCITQWDAKHRAGVEVATAREDLSALGPVFGTTARNPARALGLSDRGSLATGKRADVILVESTPEEARLVATICGGEIAWLGDARRLRAPRGN